MPKLTLENNDVLVIQVRGTETLILVETGITKITVYTTEPDNDSPPDKIYEKKFEILK